MLKIDIVPNNTLVIGLAYTVLEIGVTACAGHACEQGPKFINPRRACAAGVTVVVLWECLSVCLSVCPLLFSDYRLRGGL